MGCLKFFALVVFTFTMLNTHGQSIIVDGTPLTNVVGGPVNNCAVNGYRFVGTSIGAGNCVSLTQNTFSSGAMWVCDEINLNQSFKVNFQANFGALNSGDGIAFVLRSDANIDLVAGAGGGMGYTFGTYTGCVPPTNCIIAPSVVVEFDTWDNSNDPWASNTPSFGNINDVSCDHATILSYSDQTISGTMAGPNCLLPGGIDVTDGLQHSVCIIWDVPNLQYSVYFDSALVTIYNGDIRSNFVIPPIVRWGFTAGSGGANQNQTVCNVEMTSNPINPSCICSEPIASYLPDPVEICSGETTAITLSSTISGTTYEWSASDNVNVTGESLTPQSGAFIAETLTNTSSSVQVVNYTVTPTVACTVGMDLTIPVTVYPSPTLVGNSTVCIGSTTQLVGSGTVHPILPWLSSNTAVATITNGGVVNGLSAGTTVITYMDNNDCQTTLTLTVLALDDASFTTTDFCEGTVSAPPTLTTPGGTFFYNPNPVDGSSVNTTTGSITNGVGGSTYTLAYTTTGVCPATSTQTITVNTSPPVDVPNYTACSVGTTTLTATGATTYTWSPATNLNVTTGASVDFTAGATTTYTVTGTDANGCINTDDVTVTIEPSPNVSFVADLTVGCTPLTVTFTNTTPGILSDCVWTFSDGTTLSGCGPVSTEFSTAGFYDVTLQISSVNSCFSSETYVDYIYVEDVLASFTPSSSAISELSQEINFLNNSSGAVSYFWDFGDDGTTSTEENPSHTYNEAQPNVEVKLIAYSQLGCTDTARRILLVNEDPVFYVPNTFTPDGDEINQYFQPVLTSGYDPTDFELLIYNRWGELIWESSNDKIGWDGSDENASTGLAQDGTYVWKIIFKALETDEKIEVVGHVNLIR